MRCSIMRGSGAALVAAVGMAFGASSAHAVNVSITPSSPLLGFMNVSELPANGGAYVFGQPWGVPDLRANFTGDTLKLEAAPINDTASFWYQGAGTNPGGPGVAGNKRMDASVYVEDNAIAGQTVSFSGNVTANTLVTGYNSVAFIKDFVPDYSSNVSTTVPLTPGVFNVSMATTAGHHIQYGFETFGANVWPTDVATKGFVTVTAVPEPTTLAAAGAAGLLLRRRRRA